MLDASKKFEGLLGFAPALTSGPCVTAKGILERVKSKLGEMLLLLASQVV